MVLTLSMRSIAATANIWAGQMVVPRYFLKSLASSMSSKRAGRTLRFELRKNVFLRFEHRYVHIASGELPVRLILSKQGFASLSSQQSFTDGVTANVAVSEITEEAQDGNSITLETAKAEVSASTEDVQDGSSITLKIAKAEVSEITEEVQDGDSITLKQLCGDVVPQNVLVKAEEMGFVFPTQTQRQAIPVLLSGKDCFLHAQTGTGKTLAYLLPIFSKLSFTRAAVQAIIVVPTRELGMQVARVARMLAGKVAPSDVDEPDVQKGSVTVMTLLDGGSAQRQKKWLKAAPPKMIVGTLRCISRLIDSNHLRTNAISTIVIDEADTLLGAVKEGGLLQNLLTVHTKALQRQTIFASATMPQHHRFLQDSIQNKWAKIDLVHVHVTPKQKMPSYIEHRYVVCSKQDRLDALVSVLMSDKPRAALIFVNDRSEKAIRAGEDPMTATVAGFLSDVNRSGALGKDKNWEPLILEEDDHINERTSTLEEFRQGRCLLVATDLAARGLDLPEVSHVYNVNLPPNVTSYIHRAGRTGRRPIAEEKGTVTSFIIHHELFVMQRIENECNEKFTRLETTKLAPV